MNKLTLLLLLIFCNKVSAQAFTIAELIKINKYDIDQFDTYVTQKGFKFKSTKVYDNYQLHNYAPDSIKMNGSISIDKYIFNIQKKYATNFATYSSSVYLSLKSELKKLGFIFTKKEDNTDLGGSYLLYKKGRIEITLSSSQIYDSNYDKRTAYEIGIEEFYN